MPAWLFKSARGARRGSWGGAPCCAVPAAPPPPCREPWRTRAGSQRAPQRPPAPQGIAQKSNSKGCVMWLSTTVPGAGGSSRAAGQGSSSPARAATAPPSPSLLVATSSRPPPRTRHDVAAAVAVLLVLPAAGEGGGDGGPRSRQAAAAAPLDRPASKQAGAHGCGNRRVWWRFCTMTKVMGGASAGQGGAGARGWVIRRWSRVALGSAGRPRPQLPPPTAGAHSALGSPSSLHASRTALYSLCWGGGCAAAAVCSRSSSRSPAQQQRRQLTAAGAAASGRGSSERQWRRHQRPMAPAGSRSRPP